MPRQSFSKEQNTSPKTNCRIQQSPAAEYESNPRNIRNWKDQFVSRVFELFAFVILGIRVFEMNAQPKIMQRDLLHKFTNPPKTFAFDLYALYQAHKNNYKIESFPVQFPPRLHGTSKWAATFFSRYKTILGMIKYMFKLSSAEGRL